MWLVKLGGSLQESPHLGNWLRLLADRGGGRLIVVPGGGRFADAVRAAQERWGFDNITAHHMALIAMEQYGRMLAGMEPRLRPVGDRNGLLRAIDQNEVPVWMPSIMAGREQSIPASWEMTSDSLSLWLAIELGAELLAVVKSVTPARGEYDLRRLVSAGWLDPQFPRFAERFRGDIAWFGCDETDAFARALSQERLPDNHLIQGARTLDPEAA